MVSTKHSKALKPRMALEHLPPCPKVHTLPRQAECLLAALGGAGAETGPSRFALLVPGPLHHHCLGPFPCHLYVWTSRRPWNSEPCLLGVRGPRRQYHRPFYCTPNGAQLEMQLAKVLDFVARVNSEQLGRMEWPIFVAL